MMPDPTTQDPDEVLRQLAGWPLVCTACGAPLETIPGVGLVDARSGDIGGTYDICPERYDEVTDTQGRHTVRA